MLLRWSEKFSLPEEFIKTPKIQEMVIQKMKEHLITSSVDTALRIKEKFFISDKIAKDIAMKEVTDMLLNGMVFQTPLEIKEKFSLPENDVQKIAIEGMTKFLSNGNAHSAVGILEKFSIPDSFLKGEDVQKAAEEGMDNCLSGYRSNNDEPYLGPDEEPLNDTEYELWKALKIKEKFFLPVEITQKIAIKAASMHLKRGNVSSALQIKKEFSLSDDVLKELAMEALVPCFSDGNGYRAIEILKTFALPENIIQTQEIQKAAMEGMIKLF